MKGTFSVVKWLSAVMMATAIFSVPRLLDIEESGPNLSPVPVPRSVTDAETTPPLPEVTIRESGESRKVPELRAEIAVIDALQETVQPESVSVWGTIQTEFGDVSGYDRITLYSPTRDWMYRAYSDYTGYFHIDSIAPAKDYYMRVIPRGNFQQYVRNSIDLTASETDLSAVVSAVSVATLNGLVVNSDGFAITGYGIKVQNPNRLKWAATAITDELGRFRVENIPLGELEFSSTFGHPLRITGYEFTGEIQSPIILVVDHGANELRGQVYDQFNNLISGARVKLGWENSDAGVRSVVNRHTTTSSTGEFFLQGIGRGEHELVLTTAAGVTHRQMVDIGISSPDLTIVLSQTN